MKRATVVLLLVLTLTAPAFAQATPTSAVLTVRVQADGSERSTLAFDALRPGTQYSGICLPGGARETRVWDADGDVDFQPRVENERRVLTFEARSSKLRIDMLRPAPAATAHPFYSGDVNFCVPVGSAVRVDIEVPETHTLFFISDGGTITGGTRASVTHDGPVHVFYSYEAPLDDGALALFEERPFRVVVAADALDRTKEAIRLAVAPYASALAEAGLRVPFDAIRVRYMEETPLAWEAGHYNGRGYVEIRKDTLTPDPTQGYPIVAAKVIVHEAFHAASFPEGRGNVNDTIAWWLEGTARRSERTVDLAAPNATTHCESSMSQVRCWSFDDRLTRAQLDVAYGGSFTFDPHWEPSTPQSDDTRRFYYAYSEFVVSSWIERHGVAAYREAWATLRDALTRPDVCPCDDGWLVAQLGDPALFRPYEALRSTDPTAFESAVGPLLKDEAALERALAEQAGPIGRLLTPSASGFIVLLALAAVAGTRRTTRR